MIKAIFTYIDKKTGDQVWKANIWTALYANMDHFEREIEIRGKFHDNNFSPYVETWQFIEDES